MAGRPVAFVLAVATLIVWGVTGPVFGFTDTWQLVINTMTTIVTFLMVFLIQNTQNRDTEAMQLKLDELLRAVKGAHTTLIDLEEDTEQDIERLKERYAGLAHRAKERSETGGNPAAPSSGESYAKKGDSPREANKSGKALKPEFKNGSEVKNGKEAKNGKKGRESSRD